MDNNNSLNESLFGFDDVPNNNQSSFTYGNATIPTNTDTNSVPTVNNQIDNNINTMPNNQIGNNSFSTFNNQANTNSSPNFNNQMNTNSSPGFNNQMNINSVPNYSGQANNNTDTNPYGSVSLSKESHTADNTSQFGNSAFNSTYNYANNNFIPAPQNQFTNGYANPNQNMQMNFIDDETREANKLCIISLICYVVAPAIFGILSYIPGANIVSQILSTLAFLTAIITMIICRVKYPNNKFGKVLMWVYIILTVIEFLFLLIAAVVLMAFCESCMSVG